MIKLYYTKDFEKFGSVENIGLCDLNIKFMSTKPIPKKVKKWSKIFDNYCEQEYKYYHYYDDNHILKDLVDKNMYNIFMSSVLSDIKIKLKNSNINMNFYDKNTLILNDKVFDFNDIYDTLIPIPIEIVQKKYLI